MNYLVVAGAELASLMSHIWIVEVRPIIYKKSKGYGIRFIQNELKVWSFIKATELREQRQSDSRDSPHLRVSLEVSFVKRLEVALVRAWGRGLVSWWDRVGDVGGAE